MTGNGLLKGRMLINLLVMIALWVTSCFDYGMINIYMKYVPGTIYLNFAISGTSEILAHITVGLVYIKLTPRWTFFIGYAVALAGGICLIFQNKFGDNAALVAFFVLLAKYGISMTMCACYVSTPFVFPVMSAGLAFAICNIFGRLFSTAAPYAAELKIPLPMELFTVMAIIGLLLCLLVKTSDD
mmetsp:Transcript_19198/g.26007  ORF Transcript_19198/g.26007 Transcript_19198/m.26007 type:complete len:185 (+) Transcript_19198:1434-1988(+)